MSSFLSKRYLITRMRRTDIKRPGPFFITAVIGLMVLSGCTTEDTEPGQPLTAQEIVDRAIEVYGGDALEHARMTFDFRGRQFVISRNSGVFSYERHYQDSTGASISEILSNDGFRRLTDGQELNVDDEELLGRMQRSVNAVVYFTRLPFPLNDGAVIKNLLEETTIKGEPYYEIEVTFQQEGGGRDFQDRFIYWFHREHFTMDYMAYYFYTDDEGSRFREAINVREIGGVRIQDYKNYTTDGVTFDTIQEYDDHFNNGNIRFVSDIINENIIIDPYVAN